MSRQIAFRPGPLLDDQLGSSAVYLLLARLGLLSDQLGEDAAGGGHGPLSLALVVSIHIVHIDVDIPASLPLRGLYLDRLHPFAQVHDLRPQRLDIPTLVVLEFL